MNVKSQLEKKNAEFFILQDKYHKLLKSSQELGVHEARAKDLE